MKFNFSRFADELKFVVLDDETLVLLSRFHAGVDRKQIQKLGS